MKIALFGSTSQIAKDLIKSFTKFDHFDLILFARHTDVVCEWLSSENIVGSFTVATYSEFNFNCNYDVIINFVGVGNPSSTSSMGSSIFHITEYYDNLALKYLKNKPNCRYLFLSSGAAYGSDFEKCVNNDSIAVIPLNNFQSTDWYGMAKLYAECRHRAMNTLPIVDIRVFNYFSHTQNLKASFLISEIINAIKNNILLKTSADNIIRDYIGPVDFHKLVSAILSSSPANDALDCYTNHSVDKFTILNSMSEKYNLKYEIVKEKMGVNATGNKINYYSMNKKALYYGYKPIFTSLENILSETKILLNSRP
jgi:nucleoside-diphosphate-sugar epimerase